MLTRKGHEIMHAELQAGNSSLVDHCLDAAQTIGINFRQEPPQGALSTQKIRLYPHQISVIVSLLIRTTITVATGYHHSSMPQPW
jgi:hypothetical protein